MNVGIKSKSVQFSVEDDAVIGTKKMTGYRKCDIAKTVVKLLFF